MRIFGGALLAFAMVGLTAVAWADDIQWRPTIAATPAAPNPSPVQLARPAAISDPGVRTVSFQVLETERTDPSPVLLKEDQRTEPSPVQLAGEPAPESPVLLKETETMPAAPPLPEDIQALVPVAEFAASGFASQIRAVTQPASEPVTLAAPQPICTSPYPTESWARLPGPIAVEEGQLLEGPAAVPTRFYGGVDYLLWWIQGDRVPPLLTTGQPADQGILGRSGTTVLYGGSIDNNPYSGVRATFGWWCDCDHQLGIDIGGFVLPRSSSTFTANSNEFPVLARPFFSINPGANFGESRELATFPGLSQGSVSIGSSTDLWGVEANLRHNLCCGCWSDCTGWRLDAFAGPRVLGLNESLTIAENLNSIVPGVSAGLPNGGSAFVYDRFSTSNTFYGGQAGVDWEVHRGPWSVDLVAKLALGDTHQVVSIDGGQVLNDNVLGVRSYQGGLLALPTNIGHYTQDRFTVIPELGLTAGYQLTEHIRLTAGYSFLYWSSVVRPGGQIDRYLDVTNIPNFTSTATPTGQRSPAPLLETTGFWAQGLNFGVEIKY